ncbi:MAG: bifunctional glutamate N-acetyltransferase/amino-acid acetyltransferase ArgJ [Nitrospirae bacterium]|nr:bifunctional glutamate N-acetyltransferase/amino-acid acetyltransferase ArgJ [Nitrospirota bacterium]
MTAPKGFRASGVACGIKKNEQLDLALLVSDVEASVAGVATTNRIKAAPIVVDQPRLKRGRARAVVINSGCANACTGAPGLADAKAMAAEAANVLGVDEGAVLVASTGVIGARLPMDRVRGGIARAALQLAATGGAAAAAAILTTDTLAKEIAVRETAGRIAITVGGMAKGSGMIHPQMATMLAFLTTDAAIAPRTLQSVLKRVVDATFNAIDVDGETSPNDLVLCLANGQAKNTPLASGPGLARFEAVMHLVCERLALMIVRDGEGASKLVTLRVTGASSTAAAKRVLLAVARSPLVKTAWHGEDANWGRTISAIGNAGVPLRPDRIALRIGPVAVVRQGVGAGSSAEAEAAIILKQREFTVTVDLGQGRGEAMVRTCDLSEDYVRINASYRS